MASHRLEHYSSIPQQPAVERQLTFLDLPYSVRKRVYEHTDLGLELLDLNWSNLKASIQIESFDASHADHIRFPCHHGDMPVRRDSSAAEESWTVNLPDDQLLRLEDVACEECDEDNPYNLLFVSKQISKETTNFLYGQGTFRIDQSMPNGLRRLKLLGSDAISALGSLIIRLDLPRSQVDDCENTGAWPEPLDINCKSHAHLIEEWAEAVERIAKLIRPGQLKLYLCFRAMNVETIQNVLLPWQRLPKLRGYGIWTDIPPASQKLRLEHDLEWPRKCPLEYLRSTDGPTASRVSSLVERAKNAGINDDLSSRPAFGYLDLPQEIRFMILEYSDLVMFEDVQWQPPSQIVNYTFPADCQCSFEELEEIGGCICYPYTNSGIVRRPPSHSPDNWSCCGVCGPFEDRRACFCSTPEATWSSSCKCHRYHHPLFYVSKEVRQDAIPIYYHHNRFVLTPYGCPSMRPNNRSTWEPPLAQPLESRCELSIYLSMLTHGAMGHIRWLEWAMPDHNQAYMDRSSAMWRDYLDTVQIMEHAMNIPQLTFVINMSAFGAFQNSEGGELFETPHDLCTNRHRWRCYADKIKPLVRLHHLKDFFVYLRRDTPEDFRVNLEKEFEQLIKGPNYDSAVRGKPEERFRWYETFQEMYLG